ncbi:MAG: sulfur oxidation c-type cytochrome SoxX [Silicimonas sp.]
MRQIFTASAAIVLSAGFGVAQDIAPTAVSFEDGAVATTLSGMAGDPESGRQIMNKGSGNCIACHQVTALEEFPFHGTVGPSLDGAADRWSEAELRGIVTNAKEMFPETMMPSFYRTEGYVRPGNGFTGKAVDGEVKPLLTAQQIEDVVAFLMTLKEE